LELSTLLDGVGNNGGFDTRLGLLYLENDVFGEELVLTDSSIFAKEKAFMTVVS